MSKRTMNLNQLHEYFANSGFEEIKHEELQIAKGGRAMSYGDAWRQVAGSVVSLAGIAFNTATGW